MKITLPCESENIATNAVSNQEYGFVLFKNKMDVSWRLGLITYLPDPSKKQLVCVENPNQTWEGRVTCFQFKPVVGKIVIEVP